MPSLSRCLLSVPAPPAPGSREEPKHPQVFSRIWALQGASSLSIPLLPGLPSVRAADKGRQRLRRCCSTATRAVPEPAPRQSRGSATDGTEGWAGPRVGTRCPSCGIKGVRVHIPEISAVEQPALCLQCGRSTRAAFLLPSSPCSCLQCSPPFSSSSLEGGFSPCFTAVCSAMYAPSTHGRRPGLAIAHHT